MLEKFTSTTGHNFFIIWSNITAVTVDTTDTVETAGFKHNKAKCAFLLPKVEYLGHIIDESGLHPMQKKVKAIQEAPAPKNLAELRSFLGIIN